LLRGSYGKVAVLEIVALIAMQNVWSIRRRHLWRQHSGSDVTVSSWPRQMSLMFSRERSRDGDTKQTTRYDVDASADVPLRRIGEPTVIDVYVYLQSGPITNKPMWLLLVFQQHVLVFARNFTQLLNNKTCTLAPSFVKICPEMTKLCCYNECSPQFLSVPSVMQNWLQGKQAVPGSLKLSRFVPAGLLHLGYHAGRGK